ncbi:MAG: ankyrin repeat domain-containing protein [Gammaproteobacteria bacterium]|nr:ankyrin repeat domain-containing protein [Gammaproteobacteria bacterium]
MQRGLGVDFDRFIEAAEAGGEANLDIVNRYIAANRNNMARTINATDQYGDTALILATSNGHAPIITALLNVPGIAINAANLSGYTALIWATCNGHTPVVTALLSVPGIAINATDQFGSTALILAACYGHAPIVTALLSVPGIAINATAQFGNTALILATHRGHAPIVTALLNAPGIDITKINNHGRTAEQEAVRMGNHEISALIRARILELARLENHLEVRGGHVPEVQMQLAPTFEERLKNIEFNLEEIDKDFLCPISLCVMDDPITVSSGIAYNRASLVQAFLNKGNPQTIKCAINPNHNIAIGELRNCTTVFLKNKIETFVKEQEKIAKNKIDGEIKRMEEAASSMPAEEPKENSSHSEMEKLIALKKSMDEFFSKSLDALFKMSQVEHSQSSSSVAAQESEKMRLARLRANLFAPSIQSHQGNNDVVKDASSVAVLAASTIQANPMQQ